MSKVMKSTKFITPEEFIYNMLLPITTIGNVPNVIDESCEILRAYLDEIPDSPEPGMLSSDMITIAANMTKNYENSTCRDFLKECLKLDDDSLAAQIVKELDEDIKLIDLIEHIESRDVIGDVSKPEGTSILCKLSTQRSKPLIGRKEELSRTIEILSRMDKSNPIHVGPPGVGKTAIVKELACLISEGNVPDCLKGYTVYSLEIAELLAGARFRGDMEERLKQIMEDVSKQKAIIYIDEIHMIVGAGKTQDSTVDVANILKPYLTDSSVKFIGATTSDEYRKYFEKDKALSRRFQKVAINEPSREDAISILNGLIDKYAGFHNVTYDEGVVEEAVDMSIKFIHDRYLPDKAIDLIDEAGAKSKIAKKANVTVDDIKLTLSSTCNIVSDVIDEKTLLKNCTSEIKKQVFGQDKAIQTVTNRIKLVKSGIIKHEAPIGSFLFVGPTGVGKTEVSKAIASHLGLKLLRFDMSEYTEEHSIAKLFGSPAGYVGYEDGGLLTNAVRESPSCVLLLDEIEKAHPKIYNALLQTMDYGVMTDSQGHKVDFKNAILIMTSNCGAHKEEKTSKLGFGTAATSIESKNDAIMQAVEQCFPPEFRGRLSDVVIFNEINSDTAKLIAHKELKTISDNLAEHNVLFKVNDSATERLVKEVNTKSGARGIKNIVQNEISALFVDELLYGRLSENLPYTAELYYENDKFQIKLRKRKIKA